MTPVVCGGVSSMLSYPPRVIVSCVVVGFSPDRACLTLSKQNLTGILGYDGDYEQPAKVYNRGHDS